MMIDNLPPILSVETVILSYVRMYLKRPLMFVGSLRQDGRDALASRRCAQL